MRSKIFLILCILFFNSSCANSNESSLCDFKLDGQLPKELKYSSLEYLAVYNNTDGYIEKLILSRENKDFFVTAISQTNKLKAIKIKIEEKYGRNIWEIMSEIELGRVSRKMQPHAEKKIHSSCGAVLFNLNIKGKTEVYLVTSVHELSFKMNLSKREKSGAYKFEAENLKEIYYYLGAKLSEISGDVVKFDYSEDEALGEVVFYTGITQRSEE